MRRVRFQRELACRPSDVTGSFDRVVAMTVAAQVAPTALRGPTTASKHPKRRIVARHGLP
jgi:hypothetical protein